VSDELTLDVAPQVGLVNVQTDALVALNIHSSIQDKLKEIFEAIKPRKGQRIQDNKEFYSLIRAVIKSNICHRTTVTRFGFGLFERKTEIDNHLIR
jgi:hypothetical protein